MTTKLQTLEVPVTGMDCAQCTQHVHQALAALPGVRSVQVLLAAEKAVLQLDPRQTDLPAIRQAVAAVGYTVPEADVPAAPAPPPLQHLDRRLFVLLGGIFALVVFIVVGGEWLGLLDTINERVPWPLGLLAVLVAGFPIFRNVARAALRGQVLAHTLMSLGVVAALAVGNDPFQAACAGAFVHGLSAELLAKERGVDRGVLAHEIADGIPYALAAVRS